MDSCESLLWNDLLWALRIAPLIGELWNDDCCNAEEKVIINDVHIILGLHRTRFQGFRLVTHEIMSASELILGEERSLLILRVVMISQNSNSHRQIVWVLLSKVISFPFAEGHLMNVSDETGSHQDSTQCVSIRKVGERPVSEKKNYDFCYELVDFLHSKGILVINYAYLSWGPKKIAKQNSAFCDAQLINGVTKYWAYLL